MSDAQQAIDDVVREVRGSRADGAQERLLRRMSAEWDAHPPPTWSEAVVEEAAHGHRYVVGHLGTLPSDDDPPLGWDRALAWPWTHVPGSRRSARPSKPLALARVAAWTLVAVAVVRTWGRWRR